MSTKTHRSASCLLAATLAATWLVAAGALAAVPVETPWPEKVHPALLRDAAGAPIEFLVVLADQADLGRAESLGGKTERGRFVFETLRDHAARTQAPLRALLGRRGVEHRPFWIANVLWVRGRSGLIEELARRPEVRRIEPNPAVRFALPAPADGPGAARAAAGIEWNVSRVNADAVWTLGYTGNGVVVAGQDTGYRWDHQALKSKYRGWNGFSAQHDYSWHDAIHASSGPCGANALAPCDDHGHGTHTMGTMVGDDGGSNRVGVAPGARWIGCRNMDGGNGTPATYAECFQWFLAPTNLAGQNPDPALAPDVIDNSWACPPSEGCAVDTLRTIVENTRAAGIVVVTAAGNEGPGCSSVIYPPGTYTASFSVGATDSAEAIAGFSSRGPVTIDGSGRRKPDVSAPGAFVRSSLPSGTASYGSMSGTSMAAPHVVGLVALLLEARPDLRGRVEEIETLIERSAAPRTTSQACGADVPGESVPNNVFGYGRADALAMLQGDADGDTVENLSDCAPVDGATWAPPGVVDSLVLDRTGGTRLTWTAPLDAGASAPRYDVLRSSRPDDFSAATCLLGDSTSTEVEDPETPPDGHYYLVRIENDCGATLGAASDGTPRSGPACP